MSKREQPRTPSAPFHAPFSGLADRLGIDPASLPSAETPPTPEKADPPPARAVVRLERKGRGGKEVTLVEKLALPPRELARWLSELKGALGCGGVVEGEALVLQGDQRERVRALLAKRGVRKIAVG